MAGQPRADWVLPRPANRVAGLRMRAVPAPADHSLWLAPNLLLQKLPAPEFTAEVTLTLGDGAAEQRAGLIVFGYNYGWIGLRRDPDGQVALVHSLRTRADKGGTERTTIITSWPADRAVRLRVALAADLTCRFAYRPAGSEGEFITVPELMSTLSSRWVGAKVGVFSLAPPDAPAEGPGYADFSRFTVTGPDGS